MAKRKTTPGGTRRSKADAPARSTPVAARAAPGRPSALVDTRVIYCGDCLEQLRNVPDGCIDLIYIDPPFNSNRNYEVFWGETKEKRATPGREDRQVAARVNIGIAHRLEWS